MYQVTFPLRCGNFILTATVYVMLRKVMSDVGAILSDLAILSEILRQYLPRTHNLVLRKEQLMEAYADKQLQLTYCSY